MDLKETEGFKFAVWLRDEGKHKDTKLIKYTEVIERINAIVDKYKQPINGEGMTKEERELLQDNLSQEIIDEWGGTITKLMRLHTRHIAEKVVEDEILKWNNIISFPKTNIDPNDVRFIGTNILTRIKQLTKPE